MFTHDSLWYVSYLSLDLDLGDSKSKAWTKYCSLLATTGDGVNPSEKTEGVQDSTAQGRSLNNRPCCGRSSLCILYHRSEAVGASAHGVIGHKKRFQKPASRTSLALNEGGEVYALILRRVCYSTLRCVCVCVFFLLYWLPFLLPS